MPVDVVEAIPPGTLYDTRDGWRQWYRTPHGAAEAEEGFDVSGTAHELRLVLEEAVAKWMVADVEVGSFLSGGLDSSIIAAIAQKVLRETGKGPLKTFSVGTEGSPDLIAARGVAEHIGSEHREYAFTVEDVIATLPHVIYHLESADVDLVRSAIPTLFAARLARAHVKAVLTGEGADELFAGYAYHHAYVDDPRALADELTRSLGTMHNINLQRVDRVTMAESLEARTPFLDRDLIDFAQAIPASLKLCRTDPAGGGIDRRDDGEMDPAQGLRRSVAGRSRLAQEGAVRRGLGHGGRATGGAETDRRQRGRGEPRRGGGDLRADAARAI
jgi:asparagine synthase (glutamine-hydrolysing)